MTRCWKMCSLPRRICGNSGCKLASSQIIAMRVKQPRSLPRDTSCTISVFLARLRARCLHTASPRFWSQCSLQAVSSRLIRSTALFADCSSAKFQNCHAASACQGTLHHRLINMVWQDENICWGNPLWYRLNGVWVVVVPGRRRRNSQMQGASQKKKWGFEIAVHGMTTKCAGQPGIWFERAELLGFLCPESGPEILHHLLTRSQFWA